MFIFSSEHRLCFILLFHFALGVKRAFSCQLIVTVAAFVTVSEGGSPPEAVAHIVGYHIVNAAYPGEHSLCAEFFGECDKSAFCNVYLKAVAVDIAVIYLPVKGGEDRFSDAPYALRLFCGNRSDMFFPPYAKMASGR